MVGGLLMKSSSEFMLRRELFNLSPSPAASKSLYIPSARKECASASGWSSGQHAGIAKRICSNCGYIHSDAMKFEGVMKTLVQHFDSCHFAYTNVTKCVSDKKMKFEHDNDKADSLFVHDPLQFAVYSRLKCFVSKLVETIYGAVKTNKKINYEDKCSKQLCREVLASELVRYGKDKKTSANIEGVQYENRVGGKENSMAGNEYLVVTILVLASGMYSIPSSMGNTEHVMTALQEFDAIPKSKLESLEVLWTRDEVVSEQELERDFPLLEPIDPSGGKI
ncbi:uncharacterized protein LOC141667849 [Apium graveolens]|uniref:uncharacterized protein LOC141667849 n=1 Tax=Apium graveolens TaxID=4045 RepID=UPI003D7B0538